MKKRNGTAHKKWRQSIAKQLMLIFGIVFLCAEGLSFTMIYRSTQKTLLNNYEKSALQYLRQAGNRLADLDGQMEWLSLQVLLNADIKRLYDNEKLSAGERTTLALDIIDEFGASAKSFGYVDSVIYYDSKGYIFRYSENGNSIEWYEPEGRDGFFNATEEYQKLMDTASPGCFFWFGGCTDRMFQKSSYVFQDEKDAEEYMVSAGRNVRYERQTGGLVLNIQEKYFSSLYTPDGGMGENICVTDKEGKVISSGNKKQIGTILSVGDIGESGVEHGRLETDTEGRKSWVIYYHIPETEWYLINTIALEEITKDVVLLRNRIVLWLAIGLITAVLLSAVLLKIALKPLYTMVYALGKVGEGQFGFRIEEAPDNEIGMVMEKFNEMSSNMKTLFEQVEETQEEKRVLEIDNLKNQMNPHLISNTLNAIKWMAEINQQDNIVDCITAFNEMLKPVFRSKGTVWTLRDETDLLNNYIKVMNYRVMGMYQLRMEIPETYYNLSIQKFMLQPLVENSVLHGMLDKTTGVIQIEVEEKESDLYIYVSDNGVGISPERRMRIQEQLKCGEMTENRSSIGLGNINRRMKIYYGEEYGVFLEETEERRGARIGLKVKKEPSV